MIRYLPALLLFLFVGVAVAGLNQMHIAETKKERLVCTEGVVCSSLSQIDCFPPEKAYAPEFGLVCLK